MNEFIYRRSRQLHFFYRKSENHDERMLQVREVGGGGAMAL